MPVNHKDTFLFLLTCSRRSLGDFLLARLDEHTRLKKELLLDIEAKLDRIADNLWEIRLAILARDHGEEILERLASPQSIPPQRIVRSPFLRPAKKA